MRTMCLSLPVLLAFSIHSMSTEKSVLEGIVIKGARLGHTLGFPTANIDASKHEGRNGVYLVSGEGVGQVLHGVANLGRRPTVGSSERLLEVPLFDFDGDLYGLPLKVTLISKLRDEMQFESIEEMAEQVHRDIARARTMLI